MTPLMKFRRDTLDVSSCARTSFIAGPPFGTTAGAVGHIVSQVSAAGLGLMIFRVSQVAWDFKGRSPRSLADELVEQALQLPELVDDGGMPLNHELPNELTVLEHPAESPGRRGKPPERRETSWSRPALPMA